MKEILSNIKDMLKDRGYRENIILTDNNISYGPYNSVNKQIKIYILRNYLNNSGIYDFNISNFERKILMEDCLKDIILSNNNSIKIILVVPKEFPTKSILLNDISRIVVFSELELSFNITKNIYVPKHKKLNSEERNMFLSKTIKKYDLPSMTKEDPVCKWYDYEKDDIIKIYREYCDDEYFRIVV